MSGTGSLSKSVSLRIVTDAGTAKQTIDDIAAKADNLNGKRSSLVVNVSSGDTKAQLDEITAKADALGIKNVQFKVKADTAEANAKLDETKAKADGLGKSMFGAVLGISGFGDATALASGDASMFQKVLAGVNLATGVLEPLMAGAIVTVGGLASGLLAAGAGAGVFALAAKGAFTDVTNADTANKKLTGGLGELQTSLKSATAEYNQFVTQSANGVASVLAPAMGLLPKVLKLVVPLLPPVESALRGIVADVSKGLGGSEVTGFFKDLAANAGPALTKIATAIGHVILGIMGILKAFMPVSQGLLSGLDSITAKFEAWGQTLSGHSGFQSLMSMFKTETPLAVQTLKNLASAVLGIGKAMTGLDGVGNSKALLQILEPISGLLAKLANGNPVLDRTVLYMLAAADAGKKLSGVFTGLKSGVDVLKGVSSGVQDFSSGFQNASAAASDATGMWGTFGGKISGLGDMFKSAAVKMGILRAATVEGTEAQEGLDVAMDANPLGLIIIAVAGLVTGIVLLTTHCKAFRDFWKDVWSDIKLAFDDAFGFIKNNWQLILGILTFPIGGAVLIIMKYWGDIKNGFHDLFNDIKQSWPVIKEVLEAPINLVVGFFEKLPGRIMSAVNDLPGLFKNLGVLIINGLWNGVLSLGNWLWNQITSFVQSYVINPVKSILSIFSPSKVFHGFGTNLVQGLVLGINDNAHHAVSAVSSLSRMVASAFNPQLTVSGAGSLAAGARGNVSNTFHIQVAGVVGDAAATGRQLAESLNEYLRQTGQPELVGGV